MVAAMVTCRESFQRRVCPCLRRGQDDIAPAANSKSSRGSCALVPDYPLPSEATHITLPAHGVPPMSPGERVLLTEALLEGNRVFWSLAAHAGQSLPGLDKSREFLFRRWVLEALLVLRIQGPSSYNALSRALGWPAGESLAPKLDVLRGARLVSRSVIARSPLRVQYTLTSAGEQLGSGIYALTRWKGLHALAARDPSVKLPEVEDLGQRVSISAAERRGAFERYLEVTSAFTKTREAFCRPVEFEDGLATARRFCRAWVHKWHSRVLHALALGGPMRFADLRQSLGIGDQALAVALAGLMELRSIQPALYEGGKRYAVAPFGWSDLALGTPLGLLILEARRPKAEPEGHSQ